MNKQSMSSLVSDIILKLGQALKQSGFATAKQKLPWARSVAETGRWKWQFKLGISCVKQPHVWFNKFITNQNEPSIPLNTVAEPQFISLLGTDEIARLQNRALHRWFGGRNLAKNLPNLLLLQHDPRKQPLFTYVDICLCIYVKMCI